MNDGVGPYGIAGKTGMPRGSAASTATCSERIESTERLRYECCSVLPSGWLVETNGAGQDLTTIYILCAH